MISAMARLATRGGGKAANAMCYAILHPKVMEKNERGGALATANVSFTLAGMKQLCFRLKMDAKALVSAR